MRHRRLNKRFGRNNAQRKELMRSLVRGLFISYRIETTLEKAKEARRLAERLITIAKRGTLSDIRAINDILQDRSLVRRLTEKISPVFKNRNGGYTRFIRSGFRRGDGAPLALLELIEKPAEEKKIKKPKKEKPAKEPALEKPAEEKKEAVKERPLPPKEEKPKPPPKPKQDLRPKEEARPEEEKPKEEKPKEEKPLVEKKGLFGRLKSLFKKDKQ